MQQETQIWQDVNRRFEVSVARGHGEAREAIELYRRTSGVPAEKPIREADLLSLHLCVREVESGEIVATTRILTQEQAMVRGGFYAQRLFSLRTLRRDMLLLETSHFAVVPRYTTGKVFGLLFSKIAATLLDYGYDGLLGVVEVPLTQGPAALRTLVANLLETRAAPQETLPKLPLPNMAGGRPPCPVPPLLASWLELGARICGPAAWEPELGCGVVLTWLDARQVAEWAAGERPGAGVLRTSDGPLGAQNAVNL